MTRFRVVGTSLSPKALPDGDRMVVWLQVWPGEKPQTQSAHLSELREVLAEAEKQASALEAGEVPPLGVCPRCKCTWPPMGVCSCAKHGCKAVAAEARGKA